MRDEGEERAAHIAEDEADHVAPLRHVWGAGAVRHEGAASDAAGEETLGHQAGQRLVDGDDRDAVADRELSMGLELMADGDAARGGRPPVVRCYLLLHWS